MDEQYTPIISEEERAARRARRAAARKRKQQALRRRRMLQTLPAVVFLLVLAGFLLFRDGNEKTEQEPPDDASALSAAAPEIVPEEPEAPYAAVETAATVRLGDAVNSGYAVLIDLQSDTILAEKEARTVISPASMTKIMTLLVAAEHVTDLDDTFTMTIDITDYCYVNDCSVVGLMVGETVSVRELLYGTILPSGADAAMGLAVYTAGSHEAFVELMNQKAEELGLSETTHFTNCVGLYDEAHACTAYDMAMILKAAMDNDLCREIMNARTYETVPTADHPDGQILSNWFLRRIEDKDTGDVEVVGAKTGYVVQSGSCAASCGEDPDGNRYICVTGDATSNWQAIYDHAALYLEYCN
nr:serine hydrolase [uncultured Oscillibacter sp.]